MKTVRVELTILALGCWLVVGLLEEKVSDLTRTLRIIGSNLKPAS